jgi:hypothetical protein
MHREKYFYKMLSFIHLEVGELSPAFYLSLKGLNSDADSMVLHNKIYIHFSKKLAAFVTYIGI